MSGGENHPTWEKATRDWCSLCSWQDSGAWGTFLVAEPPCEARVEAARDFRDLPRGKIRPATFRTSFECWALLTPCLEPSKHEDLCNTKLTWKRARASITVESWTRQLFVESYSGSRQDMLQLLQTWETKFFIKWSFRGNKKLYTSKEVKEFPKMLQRSNSVRDKNHRKSMLECTGNTSASWPLNQQRYHFAQSKTRMLHSILHPYF